MGAHERIRLGGRRLRPLLLPALLIAIAPTAQALGTLRLANDEGQPLHGPYMAWANAAHVPLPSGTVRISLEGCPSRPDLVGCVITRSPRTIYLRPDSRHTRSTFLHELGHVFDLTVMRNRDRAAFKRIHRRGGRSWWGGVNPTGEWFAEAYSLCGRFGPRLPARASATYGYRPSARRHRRTCRVIRDAAVTTGDRIGKPERAPAPPTLTEPPPPPPEPSPSPAPQPPQCFLLIFCG